MMRASAVTTAPFERLSIRASLALGVVVTLALWLYTGYTFTRRLADVEREASAIAARYLAAQELLTTVRTQVLVASVLVRDALLNEKRQDLAVYRERLLGNHGAIDRALDAYVPVVRPEAERAALQRLRRQIDDFRTTSLEVLDARSSGGSSDVRQLLNAHIVPRREAAVRISEEVQALNRAAYVAQQTELDAVHRSAETQSLRRLGVALGISMAVLGLAAYYGTRLERRLYSENERSARLSRELQHAATELMHAQERERRAIARELHDEVGQVLTTVKVELGLACRAMEARGVPSKALAEAQEITTGAIQTVRDISQLLHPSTLDDLGLVAAIEALVRGIERRHVIAVTFKARALDGRLDRDVETAIYRIVQEALTNVSRHSRATTCRVELTRVRDTLVIEVSDNGAGFDADAPQPRRGLGLIGIRERVAELGGRLDLSSTPGAGTHLHVELPLSRDAAREEVRIA